MVFVGGVFWGFSGGPQKPPSKTLAVALFCFGGVLGTPQKYRCTQRGFLGGFWGVFGGRFGGPFLKSPKK